MSNIHSYVHSIYIITILFGSLYLPAIVFCGFSDRFERSKFYWSVLSVFLVKIFAQIFLNFDERLLVVLTFLSLGLIFLLSQINFFDIKAKWKLHREIIKLAFIHIFVFIITLLITICTEVYNGGFWYYDWFEHYSRAALFSNANLASKFHIPEISIGERTPILHILLAHDLDGFDFTFPHYQILSLYYNTLFITSILLFFKKWKCNDFQITTFLLLTPAFLFNVIYPWPRLFSYSFVIFAAERIFFKKKQSIFLISTLCTFSVFTHLTSLVYVLPLYLIFLFKLNRVKISASNLILPFIIPFATALCWLSFIQYKQNSIKFATTNYFTIAIGQSNLNDIITISLKNLISNTLPFPLFPKHNTFSYILKSHLSMIDFNFYIIKLHSIFGMYGISGTLLLIYYLLSSHKQLRLIWLAWVSTIIILGTLIVPVYISIGNAHIALTAFLLVSFVYLFVSASSKSTRISFLLFTCVVIENSFIILLRILFLSKEAGNDIINTLSQILKKPVGPPPEVFKFNSELKSKYNLEFLYDLYSQQTIELYIFLIIAIYVVSICCVFLLSIKKNHFHKKSSCSRDIKGDLLINE